MKKNIYCILSLLGFIILFFETSIKTIAKSIKERKLTLWLSLLGKVFIWWGGLIILPAIIALALLNKIIAFNYIIGNILNIVILLYIYFAGVYITKKLYNWKISNLE